MNLDQKFNFDEETIFSEKEHKGQFAITIACPRVEVEEIFRNGRELDLREIEVKVVSGAKGESTILTVKRNANGKSKDIVQYLRRVKALAETGEAPTAAGQPSGRDEGSEYLQPEPLMKH